MIIPRLLFPHNLTAQAGAVLALAVLSGCNVTTDPEANGAAADQSSTTSAAEAAARSDDAMEGEGRMHNEMSGQAQGGSMSAPKRGTGDDAMGGPSMAPTNGKDPSPPMKDDAMPMEDESMMKDHM